MFSQSLSRSIFTGLVLASSFAMAQAQQCPSVAGLYATEEHHKMYSEISDVQKNGVISGFALQFHNDDKVYPRFIYLADGLEHPYNSDKTYSLRCEANQFVLTYKYIQSADDGDSHEISEERKISLDAQGNLFEIVSRVSAAGQSDYKTKETMSFERFETGKYPEAEYTSSTSLTSLTATLNASPASGAVTLNEFIVGDDRIPTSIDWKSMSYFLYDSKAQKIVGYYQQPNVSFDLAQNVAPATANANGTYQVEFAFAPGVSNAKFSKYNGRHEYCQTGGLWGSWHRYVTTNVWNEISFDVNGHHYVTSRATNSQTQEIDASGCKSL